MRVTSILSTSNGYIWNTKLLPMSFNGESQSPLRIHRICLHLFVHVHCSLGWVKFETRVPRLRTGWFSRGRSHAIFITSKIVCVLNIVLCDSHKQTNAAHAPQALWLTFNWANITFCHSTFSLHHLYSR